MHFAKRKLNIYIAAFIMKGSTGCPAFQRIQLNFPRWDGRGVCAAGSCEVDTGSVDGPQEARRAASDPLGLHLNKYIFL